MAGFLLVVRVLAVAWAPGTVLFRLPVGDRDRRAALAAEERAYWSVILSVTLSIALVVALAALHRYSFTRLLIGEALICAVLALAARFDLRLGSARRRIGPAACVPLALALFAAWRFAPPFEYVMGGKDPGVYINEGIRIAQRGAIVAPDQDIANVPPFARDLFLPSDRPAEAFLAPRFMGFYVLDAERGSVVGQFPHAFPASIAIAYAIDGLSGARLTVTFWGVLGVLSVYFLGARLLGRPAAAAAALLLTLHVVQLWFARYPNTDMVMQALLFAALLACARAHVDDDPFFAPVAGAVLGLLLFLRLDAIVAVGAVAAGLALGYAAGQPIRWAFWALLAAAAALAFPYYTGPMRAYIETPYQFVSHMPSWQFGALGALAIVLIALLAAARRQPAISRRVIEMVPSLVTAVVIALAIYAFAWRHPGGKLTDYDAYALRTFANFYLTVPALAAALIGYALVVRPLFWRDPAFVVTLTAFSIFFFYKIRIWPDHFWMARRFIPIILPGALLLVSGAALTGVRGRLLFTRAIRGPIGVIFIALLAVHYARAARPVLDHVEYAGIIPRLESLARLVAPDDLLIVESRNAGSDVHVLALPLAYIYSRHVLVLATPVPDKTTFAAFLDRSAARYRRVLFLGGGGTDLLSSRWTVTPLASERFQVPEYDAPRNAYPRFVGQKEFDYSVYAFGPPAPSPRAIDVDVGIDDDLNVIRFHAKEQSGGRTFRWSQGRSLVVLPRIDASDRVLSLWMDDGGRPAAAPPADVTIALGERDLGTVRVGGGFRQYDLPIPADVAAAAANGEPVRVALRVATWNPRALLGTADARDLGVMVDRVALR